MTITIHSTTKTVLVNGVDCRVWEGKTESGIEVSCLIPRIAVRADQDQRQFKAELQEQRAPSAEIEAWPLRMVL